MKSTSHPNVRCFLRSNLKYSAILSKFLPAEITDMTTTMKKKCKHALLRALLLCACGSLLSLSCSKEESGMPAVVGEFVLDEEPQMPEEEWVDASMSSVIRQDPEDPTKTFMGGASGRAVHWSANDAIGIFDTRYKGAGSRFSSEQTGDDPKARNFGGRIREFTSSFFSVYPFQEDASLNGKTLTMRIPTEQQAVNGSFGDQTALAFASGVFNEERRTDEQITFTNLCAIISFKMPSYIDGARSVVVRAKSGAAIAGTVTIDCEKGIITSVSGSSSVTLRADAMAASGTYYAVIAPGTYENGFHFTVTTAGGSTYVAQSTKTLPAAAGVIYSIGTVNLNLDTAPTVTISHTHNAAGELSGSIASLDVPGVSKEIENLITAWDATLSKNGTVVRRLARSAGTMNAESGWPYLPQGSYDISVRYTLMDGKVKTISGTATSPAPTFPVTAAGYTSYNYGVGADGYGKNVSTANGLDKSTIYGISGTIGITDEVLAQKNYTALTCALDGTQVASASSGRSITAVSRGSQSWASHAITASATFDGVTQNSATRTVYVTGLPYYTTNNKMYNVQGEWSFSNKTHHDKDENYVILGEFKSGECRMYKDFYAPGNISLNVDYKIYSVCGVVRTTTTFVVGSTTLFTENPRSWKTSKMISSSGSATMTSSAKRVYVNNSYGAGASGAEIYYINLTYK